jgi:hypothetical protein
MERLAAWLSRQRWALWLDAHTPKWLVRWLDPWSGRYWLIMAIVFTFALLITLLVRGPAR